MNLITRTIWGARTPKRRIRGNLSKPSTAHWNGPVLKVSGSITWDHSKCASLVRGIQNYHMDAKGWSDIAYNFIECPHGYTYEGRGLNVNNGANGTNDGNRTSHAVMCLAGEENPFPDSEKSEFRECVKYIADHTDAPDRCIGHRDHKATACPGNERYDWVHRGMPLNNVPVPQPSPVVSNFPMLKLGMTGDAVRQVQQIIHDKTGGNITVDGIFGLETEQNVKDIQSFFQLSIDGIVGPKTWEVLNYLATVKPTPYGNWPGQNKPTIKLGAKGEIVRYLQSVISHKAGGGIVIDSNFGLRTEQRVRNIQHFLKMPVDGIVGPQTWGIIDILARS